MPLQRLLCGWLLMAASVGLTPIASACGSDCGVDAKATRTPAAAATVITEDQLQGTWMDSEQADTYTSRWTFAKPNMTFTKYNGRVIQTTYTVSGNTLVVHHPPGLMNQEPWDETIELVRYRGDTLIWNYGTLITLHRVK